MSDKPTSAVGQFKAAYTAGSKRQREQMRAWMRELLGIIEIPAEVGTPLRLRWDGKQYVQVVEKRSYDAKPIRVQLNADGTWKTL